MENEFKQALEQSLEGFTLVRPVGHYPYDFVWEYINPAAAKILHQSRAELKDQSIGQTFPAADKHALLADLSEVFAGHGPLEAEVAYTAGDLHGWFQLVAVKSGQRLAIFLRDITEKKLWEEGLKQSEARFRVLAESNLMGLFFVNEKGEIVDANEPFLKMLGYCRDEFFQRRITEKEITPPEFWELTRQSQEEAEKKGSCLPFEKELLHKSGQRIPVLFGLAHLPAINWEKVAFVVDISEHKEIEKEREIFLGHELKNPLAGIKCLVALAQKRLRDKNSQEALTYLEKIDRKVDELTKLVNDFTDLARIRAGKLDFNDEVFEFDQLVKDFVADYQPLLAIHRLLLEGSTGKLIAADKTRLKQVLDNLVSNAVKYSPEGGEIKIKLTPEKNGVSFSVQDFGLGIPENEKEKIFLPFFRSSASKRAASGAGLGLYICAQIVKHYGGKIKVESEEGKGSTFQVCWPSKKDKNKIKTSMWKESLA